MKGTAAPLTPVAGAVFAPLRYFQSTNVDAPVAYSATQSVALPGPPAIVAETVPSGPTVVGVAFAVGLLGAGTVVARHVILTPTVYERRAYQLRKRRSRSRGEATDERDE